MKVTVSENVNGAGCAHCHVLDDQGALICVLLESDLTPSELGKKNESARRDWINASATPLEARIKEQLYAGAVEQKLASKAAVVTHLEGVEFAK